ncbi:MAG: dTMP kinase [Syntrophomonas sp.]|nr:dTMP kinase [Syntrophomonas sp.]
MQTRGFFISLEGIDGCGKTTLKENLLAQLGRSHSVIGIREPGGTVISEKIRDMLLDVRNNGIIGRTEALLYAAARSQVVEEIIRPALAQGQIIIADRYMDSTIAYQGYGRGLDLECLADLNRICTGGLKPDLTLLLDIEPREAQKRRKKEIPDRVEQEGLEFQARVQAGYIELWKKEPLRIKRLDASHTPQELAAEALQLIDLLP